MNNVDQVRPVPKPSAKKPVGKAHLNIYITEEEHAFLREFAAREGITMTMAVRMLVKKAMRGARE